MKMDKFNYITIPNFYQESEKSNHKEGEDIYNLSNWGEVMNDFCIKSLSNKQMINI